jgi:hypothetical protein
VIQRIILELEDAAQTVGALGEVARGVILERAGPELHQLDLTVCLGRRLASMPMTRNVITGTTRNPSQGCRTSTNGQRAISVPTTQVVTKNVDNRSLRSIGRRLTWPDTIITPINTETAIKHITTLPIMAQALIPAMSG